MIDTRAMQALLLVAWFSTWHLLVSAQSSAVPQPLGIGGTNDQICRSACAIGNACVTTCSRALAILSPEGGICCQDGCIGWYGLCTACYDVTVGNYTQASEEPYDTGFQGSTLQECAYVGVPKASHRTTGS